MKYDMKCDCYGGHVLTDEGEVGCSKCGGTGRKPILSKLEQLAEAKKALRAIRDYNRSEIVYDEFAYERMQEAYREAARNVLAQIGDDDVC
tara:strand:- start:94 stop:366 length:273 start_codon:yes stop_codon:yes gene_type:complete